ncbi:peptide-methionine (S)-S-oxide reductase MsrA [Planctomyces sp. SH-PL62]|uniref:peptide-methionine (S)-S-oxide reductase MsrA n=1 Tax=Planctomyces sp. SH-PL62 TaxID=1636152 RepID=UPI00078CCCCA|nr:peptide-methionine (S)-S-oxide reductase MsrA [Planctomyces sp. SH-PL62]AMV35975.1 Peptide methionine sulfoxide reductase MsrA 2 [Planctomyces sp. SH-PL62]
MSTLQQAWRLGLGLGFALVAGVAFGQEAKEAEPSRETPGAEAPATKDGAEGEKPKKPKLEQATFGGGCFWCTEAVFERIPGVKSVVSGYSGGNVANPTYEMISTGLTGHAEVIQITYDPSVISFEKLLEYFWIAHDPTTVNSQGPDHGTQYRSIILYHNEDQKRLAEQAKHDLNAKRARKSPVVTQIVPFEAFYPAEEYHQDFARNNPYHGYVETYITPKMYKLKAKLKAESKKKAESN